MKKNVRLIQALILAGSFCMIAYGLAAGENLLVLKKAINICLECIGIG